MHCSRICILSGESAANPCPTLNTELPENTQPGEFYIFVCIVAVSVSQLEFTWSWNVPWAESISAVPCISHAWTKLSHFEQTSLPDIPSRHFKLWSKLHGHMKAQNTKTKFLGPILLVSCIAQVKIPDELTLWRQEPQEKLFKTRVNVSSAFAPRTSRRFLDEFPLSTAQETKTETHTSDWRCSAFF